MSRVRRIAVAGLLLGALLTLPACSSPAKTSQDPADLTGGEWALVSSSVSSSDLGAAGITAAFDGKRMAGFSGVNQYGGVYTAGEDGAFSTGEIVGTLMAGEESAMKAEQAYLSLLAECDTYAVADGRLTLSKGKDQSLVYELAPKAELPGSKWKVTGYNNGKEAVTSPVIDSVLTIEFGTDGTVSGSGGINRYNGPFEATDTTIEIKELSSTKMAGPEDLMAQEAAFLQVLQNCETWTITRGMLEMRGEDDALQIGATTLK